MGKEKKTDFVSITEFHKMKILPLTRRSIFGQCKNGNIPAMLQCGKFYIPRKFIDGLIEKANLIPNKKEKHVINKSTNH